MVDKSHFVISHKVRDINLNENLENTGSSSFMISALRIISELKFFKFEFSKNEILGMGFLSPEIIRASNFIHFNSSGISNVSVFVFSKYKQFLRDLAIF